MRWAAQALVHTALREAHQDGPTAKARK